MDYDQMRMDDYFISTRTTSDRDLSIEVWWLNITSLDNASHVVQELHRTPFKHIYFAAQEFHMASNKTSHKPI